MKNKTKRSDKKTGKVENNRFYSRRKKDSVIADRYQIEDAKREMFGSEAEYLDDDMGCK